MQCASYTAPRPILTRVSFSYIVLPPDTWEEIWQASGLEKYKWRAEIFDCDDFALGASMISSKALQVNLSSHFLVSLQSPSFTVGLR